jgi:hypothetical protein
MAQIISLTISNTYFVQEVVKEYDISHVGFLSCKNDQAQNKFENHQSKYQKNVYTCLTLFEIVTHFLLFTPVKM